MTSQLTFVTSYIYAGRVQAASTLNVCPSGCEYSSIQSAINAANDGDVVSVGDGRYLENISFNGKAIAVKSVNGAANSIIDGNKNGSV